MGIIIDPLTGTTKLRDAWPKINQNFTNIKTEVGTIVVNASIDPEVAVARISSVKSETFATLGARLEGSEQDLVSAQAESASQINGIIANALTKLSKADIQVLIGFADINKNLSQIDSTMLTPALLSQIAGTAGVNVTPLALSVLTTMLADLAVTPYKTNFLVVGKNMYDKTTRTIGYWVDYTTGALVVSATYDTSDYIPVLSGVTYIVNKCRNLALFNTSKVYVSGVNNTSYGSATFTPTQDGFIRFATGTFYADTSQLEVGTSATIYERYEFVASKLLISNYNVALKTLTEDKVDPSSNIVVKRPGKNLINPNTLTAETYINYLTGQPTTLTNYSASDYIPIDSSTNYTLSVYDSNSSTAPLEQMAFYDVNKLYVSGLNNTGTIKSVTFATPSAAKYARLTLKTPLKNMYQLEKNSAYTGFEQYSESIKGTELEPSLLALSKSSKTVISVKLDGTGDFTTLRKALDLIGTFSSVTNQYEIQVYEGTHDILAGYMTDEIADVSFIGPTLREYVSLKGIGDKNKIILKGEIAITSLLATRQRVSTLNFFGTKDIENVTVTAKNLRYAVHDDYVYPDAKFNIKNCEFIKYSGPEGYDMAYGEGFRSGVEHVFEDCRFYIDDASYSYSTHNNVSFAKPTSHKFINCDFDNKGSQGAVHFGSLGSGQRSLISMVGCKLKGKIVLDENTVGSGVGIDFDLTGHGNDVVPVVVTTTNVEQVVYNLNGECKRMHNGDAGTITKGTLVKLIVVANNTGVGPLLSGDPTTLYFGVALQDITSGASGIIKIGGYLAISDTSLTGLALGDKIGVVGGVLAKVTTGDYIGVVTLSDFIKLT